MQKTLIECSIVSKEAIDGRRSQKRLGSLKMSYEAKQRKEESRLVRDNAKRGIPVLASAIGK